MPKAIWLIGALGVVTLTAGCIPGAQYPMTSFSPGYSSGYGSPMYAPASAFSPSYASPGFSPSYASSAYPNVYAGPAYPTSYASPVYPSSYASPAYAPSYSRPVASRPVASTPFIPGAPQGAPGTPNWHSKKHDFDRDGTANRYDRDANGDGVIDKRQGRTQR